MKTIQFNHFVDKTDKSCTSGVFLVTIPVSGSNLRMLSLHPKQTSQEEKQSINNRLIFLHFKGSNCNYKYGYYTNTDSLLSGS